VFGRFWKSVITNLAAGHFSFPGRSSSADNLLAVIPARNAVHKMRHPHGYPSRRFVAPFLFVLFGVLLGRRGAFEAPKIRGDSILGARYPPQALEGPPFFSGGFPGLRVGRRTRSCLESPVMDFFLEATPSSPCVPQASENHVCLSLEDLVLGRPDEAR